MDEQLFKYIDPRIKMALLHYDTNISFNEYQEKGINTKKIIKTQKDLSYGNHGILEILSEGLKLKSEDIKTTEYFLDKLREIIPENYKGKEQSPGRAKVRCGPFGGIQVFVLDRPRVSVDTIEQTHAQRNGGQRIERILILVFIDRNEQGLRRQDGRD